MTTFDDAFGLIAEFISKRQAVWGPPGVAIGITDREQTLWSDGFGFANMDAQTPATPRTLFQIGSVGKSFTAYLVMQAVEAGVLGLQRPIKDILTWFDVKERIRPITIEDLLLHASGLSTGQEAYESGLAEAVTMLPFDPGFGAGNGFLYSNLGFKLLGLALERLTGQRYPDMVREHILGPVGMTSSFAEITHALASTTAVGYRHAFLDRPTHASHLLVPTAFTESATADGCISSTIEDMMRYVRVFANNGAYPGGQLISQASFEIMTRGQNTDPESGDKLGFGIWTTPRFGRPILEHTGGMISHQTHMSIDPETGIGLVLLGNGSEIHRMAEYARELLCDVASGSSLRPMPSFDVRHIPNAEDFRGRWRGGQRELTLTPENGGVVAESDGQRASAELRADGVLLIPMPGWEMFLLRGIRDLQTGHYASLTHGPDRFFPVGAEGFVPPMDQALEPVVGHYRASNPWSNDLRVFQRAGKLFVQILDYSNDPGDIEYELVPLQAKRTYRVGVEDWQPDRIQFDAIVEGKTQIANYMNLPHARLPWP